MQFNEGDLVLLSTRNLTPVQRVRKLMDKFIGPYLIVSRVGATAYRLALPPHMKMHNVFHCSLLKKYQGTPPATPPPVWEDDEQQFEVEKILRHRVVRRRHKFLVLWLGYPISEATWEPISALTNASDVVRDYLAQNGLKVVFTPFQPTGLG